MTLLQHYYRLLAALFNARNPRERILISSLVTAFIINSWLLFAHDPLMLTDEKHNQQLAALSQKINSIEAQHKILSKAKLVDPNREIKQRLSLAESHINKLDKQLHIKMDGLIKPTQMAQILEQVLTQKTKLRFVRIQSMAVTPLTIAPDNNDDNDNTKNSLDAANNAPTELGVYKHGIEMEFNGSYLETLSYLKQLQQLPWHFYWDDVLFDVISYPQSRIIIRVHTLSLREGWIGV